VRTVGFFCDVAETLHRPTQVTLVGAFFDLAAHTRPVHVVRVELLRKHLKTKPERGVTELFFPQNGKPTFNVFVRNRRL
jgi:hypothetical protein